MPTREWVEQVMGIRRGRYLNEGEDPVATVTVGNIVVNGVVVSITDDISAGSPHESVEGFLDWLHDCGFEQSYRGDQQTAHAAAPATQQVAPGPSQQAQRTYAGGRSQGDGGGGYQGGGARGGGYQRNGGGYQAGNRQGGGNGGGNWVCPVHGNQKIRDGYRGGYECGISSTQQEEWTKQKPYLPRDGGEVWFCRHSSQG